MREVINEYEKAAADWQKGQADIRSVDYKTYRMSAREYVYYGIPYLLLIVLTAYVFYRSYIALLCLLPGIYPLMKRKKRQLTERRKQRLRLEFKEAISAVSSGLSAGYSVENAFIEAGKDMILLYGTEGLMTQELRQLGLKLSMNRTLEQFLTDLADRSGVDDMSEFASVFSAAKRNSGSLVSIIGNTVRIINDKVEIRREIETLISAKQLEQKVMNLIPFLIVLYIGSSSGDFLDVLYHNIAGNIIMTICLVVYIGAVILSERIVNIQV